jgi:hypothetical protein
VFGFLLRQYSSSGVIATIRRRSLFKRESPALSSGEAILWWESRRIPYNLIVGTAGLCTCIACLILALIAEFYFHSDFGMPDPPIFGIFIVILYGIMANICYTAGWIVELLLRRLSPNEASTFAENTFFLGLVFSVVLTLSPAVIIGFVGFVKFIHRMAA